MSIALPELARLESFEAEVFQGNGIYSQDLCDLILSLALAYNDLRDTTQGVIYLSGLQDGLGRSPTPKLGLVAGWKNTLTRIQFGFVRELLCLLVENQEAVESPKFQELIRKLSPRVRESWSSLLDAVNERDTKNPMTKTLIRIRNKVAFHYEAGELGRGYSSAFLSGTKSPGYTVPFVSRGSVMHETRFYFADAAAQAYMVDRVSDRDAAEFVHAVGELLSDINLALYHLITTFINSRSPWSEYRPHA